MVKKAEQDIVDKRLEDTLDLFQPTAQQAAAEAEAEKKQTPKTRDYERDNPAFAFRIRPEDNERIAELAEALEVTRDALGAGLMRAALDAIDAGRLVLDVKREPVSKRDTLGRLRSSVVFTVRGRWVNPAE